jgi:hypothetical protein
MRVGRHPVCIRVGRHPVCITEALRVGRHLAALMEPRALVGSADPEGPQIRLQRILAGRDFPGHHQQQQEEGEGEGQGRRDGQLGQGRERRTLAVLPQSFCGLAGGTGRSESEGSCWKPAGRLSAFVITRCPVS